jgi:hypothetical protein
MGIPNAKPNIGGSAQPAITRPCPNLLKAAEKQLASEPSRLWAEFRLAVVGHLAVCDLQHGQLESELSSLAAKKWKHPISGGWVTFGRSTIQRWYYYTSGLCITGWPVEFVHMFFFVCWPHYCPAR